MSKKVIKILKLVLFISLIISAVLFAIYKMNKYEKEGEKNMPFFIERMLIINTVDGIKKENSANIWDISLKENSDIYIYINKEAETEEKLKEISIENFKVEKAPLKGELKVYRPTGELDNLYNESVQNYLNDSITYSAGVIDDPKTLTIANTKGIMCFRISVENLGEYVSNDDTENIQYNGTLFSKTGVSLEEVKFNISFDIVIKLKSGINFRGTINTELPSEKLMQEDKETIEITDFSNVIFKREM